MGCHSIGLILGGFFVFIVTPTIVITAIRWEIRENKKLNNRLVLWAKKWDKYMKETNKRQKKEFYEKYKQCPYCFEYVYIKSTKCKYCQSLLK